MADIYEQHKSAFSRVAAYVVLHNGNHVAYISFKFPADGAGRLYAYVYWLGLDMTRGFAGGGGYDKASAAVANATRNLGVGADHRPDLFFGTTPGYVYDVFIHAARRDDGNRWSRNLEMAGFVVVQAI